MRKQAVLLSCDHCKTTTQVDDIKDIPHGWLRIQAGKENGDPKDAFDICTLACAMVWAKERKKAVGDPGDEQCDICGEFFGLQGKGGHMKMHVKETDPNA